jgi:hypothetical protein
MSFLTSKYRVSALGARTFIHSGRRGRSATGSDDSIPRQFRHEAGRVSFVADVPDDVRARLGQAAHLYEQAAEELEGAVAHCRRAAEHFRDGEVPRATAHAWAALGHVREAEQRLDEQAREHRLRSQA